MTDYEQQIVEQVIRFGQSREEIRAILLTSSLCNPHGPSDMLSENLGQLPILGETRDRARFLQTITDGAGHSVQHLTA